VCHEGEADPTQANHSVPLHSWLPADLTPQIHVTATGAI